MCDMLSELGVSPLFIDLSLRLHDRPGADISSEYLAKAVNTTPAELADMGRTQAAETMLAGGQIVLRELFEQNKISAAIGVGGANGSTMACAMMRALPPLFPKVMVTPVAATAAVQWYVAESDIAMYPTIGDISLNRITRTVMHNAASAVAAMAKAQQLRAELKSNPLPLIGVSSFGGTQLCVNRVTERLQQKSKEVIHFHSSGPGGKALESLASLGELAGVIDITTSELVDHVVGGVYSAGAHRLSAAGKAGIPQIVVPGALDHCNFWVGEVPERYHDREFIQYNVEILLMRTNAEEYEALGGLFAEKLNKATAPFKIFIPTRGFSQHTVRDTTDLDGNRISSWHQPDTDQVFVESLRKHLRQGEIVLINQHINDQKFADACVDAFLEISNI